MPFRVYYLGTRCWMADIYLRKWLGLTAMLPPLESF